MKDKNMSEAQDKTSSQENNDDLKHSCSARNRPDSTHLDFATQTRRAGRERASDVYFHNSQPY